MPKYPKICTALYAVSSFLDVADGQAARRLGQTSKFGAVLDMVTDRYVGCGGVVAVPP
jgi:CDP-diacylglycerol--inositol 3-phosphatidyltransferase